jgi:hypothetical protein
LQRQYIRDAKQRCAKGRKRIAREGPPVLSLVPQVFGTRLRQSIPATTCRKQRFEPGNLLSCIILAAVDGQGIVKSAN